MSKSNEKSAKSDATALTREQRAAERVYKDGMPQTFVRGAEKTRHERFAGTLKANSLKNEIGEVTKSHAASHKPAYLD